MDTRWYYNIKRTEGLKWKKLITTIDKSFGKTYVQVLWQERRRKNIIRSDAVKYHLLTRLKVSSTKAFFILLLLEMC